MIFKDMDRIIFAGDSVTDMGSQCPVGEGLFDNVGRGYVRVLESMFAAYYPEVRLRVTNSGVSGETSRGMWGRFYSDVLNHKPNWVSICIGINDVWRQFDCPAMPDRHVLPDEYRENLENMIVHSKQCDTVKGIFVLTPFLIEPNKEDTLRARMDEYVEICRELAEKHGCIFVNFQQMYEDYCQIHHPCYIAWDRVHPNQIGATLMAKEFLKHCDFDYNR